MPRLTWKRKKRNGVLDRLRGARLTAADILHPTFVCVRERERAHEGSGLAAVAQRVIWVLGSEVFWG